ncbi:type 1 glutamine amidotransferase [Phaeovulum vinaykumarii]|uniref:GMP synthase-Glutamine amidotransferase n=1 Tax=Phaeovulum vinaykumarii TaxID=407234 RepID=A0A1N7JZB9_9RHOB|nr:type 1 glutamine amidotransferase [Phaeovulum vinaykumarii]SIS54677.1 GMP synthase-Glutamine amidotransferase [Phaeovulum vinaykumarii]SOB92029.1 GMP synthase-like glutamine amidotransferase [Phaeovulum vinaykumarii]
MLIGILQTGQSPETLRADMGDYPDMFVQLLAPWGFTFRTYRVETGQFPEDVHSCEGWLITGSRHGVYEDHAFLPPLEAFIRRAMAAGVPMVGVCFGHQIMAQALGGRVERFSGGWAVGAQTYEFDGRPVRLNAWHRDQVTTPPPGAETVATHPFCAHAALRYPAGFSVQAHPEFRDAFVAGLLETRAPGVVPAPLIDQARAALGQPNDAAFVAGEIARVFLGGRAPADTGPLQQPPLPQD